MQAIVVLAITIAAFGLSIALIRAAHKNRYPVRIAAFFCFSFAIWLLINVIADRITGEHMYLLLGQLTYAVPYWVLLFAILFALYFPPKNSPVVIKVIVVASVLVCLALTVANVHPDNLVLALTPELMITTRTDLPFFYLSQIGFLGLLGTATAVFLTKRRRMRQEDKKTIGITANAFFIIVTVTIALSLASAFNTFDFYVYYYSYLSGGVFLLFFGYAVLKHGALNAPLIFSRGSISSVISGIAILAALTLMGYGLFVFSENTNDTTVAKIAIGIVIGTLIHLLFEWRWGRNDIKTSLSNPTAKNNDVTFLNRVKEKYALLSATYKKISDSALRSSHLITKANPIDIPKKVIALNKFATFVDTRPDRIALRIPFGGKVYIFGRKKFNIAFTEGEVTNIKQDIALHEAAQEVATLEAARQNHIAQLESLTAEQTSRLTHANSELYRRLRERTTFFKTVARELRTPLTIISSSVQSNALQLPRTAVNSIEGSIKKLVALSKEFELYSGMDVVDAPLTEEINLTTFVRRTVERFTQQATKKRIDLAITAATPDACISIKPLHLEAIVDNLIENALKYSPDDTVVTCRLSASPGRLTIIVEDEGAGIPNEEQALIFEPFYRIASTATQKGTGLGLSIVKKFSKLYQGNCMVSNRTPHGNRFTVDISVRTKLS